MFGKLAGLVLVLLVIAGGYLFLSYRRSADDAERAWADITGAAAPSGGLFDPATIMGQPEVVQRYFLHAIAPTVELELEGVFLLGDKSSSQAFAMRASQILAPPGQFIWRPLLRSGLLTITGSDALVDGKAWTRFWVGSLFPVANVPSSADLVRSAQFRSAIEGIWAPAALLPRPGISWQAVGPDTASITMDMRADPVVIELTIDAEGALTQVVGMRWSDANPRKLFQLQPFGGTMNQEATFDGYTIPSMVRVGNMFGTDDYFPFYEAQILRAVYR